MKRKEIIPEAFVRHQSVYLKFPGIIVVYDFPTTPINRMVDAAELLAVSYPFYSQTNSVVEFMAEKGFQCFWAEALPISVL